MLVCFRLGTHHITHTLQVLINAGQANAATGDAGYEDCVKSAQAVADALGIDSDQVLIESTGTSTNNHPDHHVADSFALTKLIFRLQLCNHRVQCASTLCDSTPGLAATLDMFFCKRTCMQVCQLAEAVKLHMYSTAMHD